MNDPLHVIVTFKNTPWKGSLTRKRNPKISDITPENRDSTTTRTIFDNSGFIINPLTLNGPSKSYDRYKTDGIISHNLQVKTKNYYRKLPRVLSYHFIDIGNNKGRVKCGLLADSGQGASGSRTV